MWNQEIEVDHLPDEQENYPCEACEYNYDHLTKCPNCEEEIDDTNINSSCSR